MRKQAALVMLIAITGLKAKSQDRNSFALTGQAAAPGSSVTVEKMQFKMSTLSGAASGLGLGEAHNTLALGKTPSFGGAAADTSREAGMISNFGGKPDTLIRLNWGGEDYKKSFPYKSLILSAAFVTYGFMALKVEPLQKLNHEVKEEMWMDRPHNRFHADNYLMYVPAFMVYGLNLVGIKGEHNFKDRTMILLLSQAMAQGTVFSLKGWTHTLRPDASAYNSFPSGHTAEAFANAEFMRMEYKGVSPWYGIAGYAVATTTGMLRMYNNKHWFNDVVAGAGIGIASTRVAYWLYPKLQHLFSGSGHSSSKMVLAPTYNNGSVGLSFAKVF